MYTVNGKFDHGECVYNLVKKPEQEEVKPRRHVSRYAAEVRKETETRKRGCQTMGPAVVPLCPPELYLRKHSRAPISRRVLGVGGGEEKLVQVQMEEIGEDGIIIEASRQQAGERDYYWGEEEKKVCEEGGMNGRRSGLKNKPEEGNKKTLRLCERVGRKRSPVPPACCSTLQLIPRGPRDFIRDNTIAAIRKPAKIPDPRYVDEPRGAVHNWVSSGLARKYVHREDYGRIPGYLVQRKLELRDQSTQEEFGKERRSRTAAAEKCRHLTEEQRKSLLAGLRRSWEEVYRLYQSLPLQVDTQVKIQQKGELEERLKSIEKDIQLVERHNHIFVADDLKRTMYLN